MKLQRLRIEQFRKFADPVEIVGLEDGLNVFHGPNEAGKSTLAQALRTLFFEKHKTRGDFAATILPTRAEGVAPVVEADFLLGGVQCTLHKTFLQSPRARLVLGSDHWDGDAADEELARRLGFSLAGRGASRAETRGIPGLLWIDQGDSHSLETPLQHARETLQERLQDIIGDIASSAGGRVAAAVEKDLRALRTPTGRATGALAEANGQLETARAEQAQLQERADAYAALIDRLAADSDTFQALERDKPWVAIQASRRTAEAQLASLRPQAQELAEKQQALEEIQHRLNHIAEQRQARETQLLELQRQRGELEQAGAGMAAALEQLEQATARRKAATVARRRAVDAHRAAEQSADHTRLTADSERIAGQITQAKQVLERIAADGEAITGLRTQAATCAVNSEHLADLREIEQTLKEVRIRRDAAATRIGYRLQPGHSIQAGDRDDLQGEGQLLATSPVTLQIGGIGEIDIIPGGDDVQRLAQEAERLESDRQRLLGLAGVANLAEAEARQEQHARILDQIRAHEHARDIALGGRSEDAWRTALAEATGQGEKLARRLAALPPPSTDALALDDARRLRDDAEAEADAADSQLQLRQDAATSARQRLDRLQAEVEAASRSLEGAGAARLAEQQLAQAERESTRQSQLRLEVSRLQSALQEKQPEQLQADIDRFNRSLTSLENERSALRDAITGARSKLEALGVDGIDEALAAATVQVERLQRRQAQYQLRADALQLLHERITASQRAVAERLYAPLRGRLEHYLRMLFPGLATEVEVAQLSPVGLVRDGSALTLDAHSHGTREQLGVLARFAYADLLKQAGQPTLLVLDDALVHSDTGRLERMKRIVADAAGRHQILLFTCHPDAWRDAGANHFIDVAALG